MSCARYLQTDPLYLVYSGSSEAVVTMTASTPQYESGIQYKLITNVGRQVDLNAFVRDDNKKIEIHFDQNAKNKEQTLLKITSNIYTYERTKGKDAKIQAMTPIVAEKLGKI